MNLISDYPPQLTIVAPCYNEEEILSYSHPKLANVIDSLIRKNKVSGESHIVFVDDGSEDNTWNLLVGITEKFERVRAIKLSRNYGHQSAILSGMFHSQGDIVITVDVDLQDDLNAIEKMVDAYHAGFEIVIGVRLERNSDTFFKKYTALLFYRIMDLLGTPVVYNHADFRLLSRRVINHIREMTETNLFLRGVIPSLGFNKTKVYYNRNERVLGKTKYTLPKMVKLALDGVTSFSIFPLYFVLGLGMFVSVGSIFCSIWVLVVKFIIKKAIPGWASTLLPVYFIGGVQLICLGVVGIYVAKIYMETKRRPHYIIETIK